MEVFVGPPMQLDYGKEGGGGELSLLRQVVLYNIALATPYVGMAQISHRDTT